MEETEQKKISAAERFAQMVLAAAVCMATLLLAITVIRFLFAGYADRFAGWYRENVCVETDINEVLSSEADDAVENV